MSAPDEPTLVVMLRRPAPGVGKQRLAATLGRDRALAVAMLLLDAALEDAAAWPGPVVLAPADAADRGWASTLLAREARVIAQPAGNLGARIGAVDSQARQRGAGALIFIGTDAPALDADYYAAAREALRTHDAIVGPAADGGVTLMGASQPWPPLEGLAWSTETLGAELDAACLGAGLRVARLPLRADIDLPGDLRRAHAELTGDARPARRALRAWIERQGLDRECAA